MTGADESTDWRKLREFAGIDLYQSYVLSWHFEAENLRVDVDLFLMPGHPFYEEPRPAEKVCIRPAIIEFPICNSIQTHEAADMSNIADAVESLGHGMIEGLRRLADGRYEIRGEFGVVTVDSERLILRLNIRDARPYTGAEL